jgi:hypothetical protein
MRAGMQQAGKGEEAGAIAPEAPNPKLQISKEEPRVSFFFVIGV